MSDSAPNTNRASWRPRISLLTALLLVALAACGITIWQLWREVEPLRADNKRLNEERGTLVIADLAKVHAIQIPARFAGEDRQSFRVYVPQGKKYVAFVQVNDIPMQGIPDHQPLPRHAGILGGTQRRLFARLEPGEHTVTIRTIRRGRKADIQLLVAFPNKMELDASANTQSDKWPSAVPEAYTVYGDGLRGTSQAVEATEPLVLLRHRIDATSKERDVYVSYTIPEPDIPLDGVMLWIEPQTPVPPVGQGAPDG